MQSNSHPKANPSLSGGLPIAAELSPRDRNPPSAGAQALTPAFSALRDASATVDLSHAGSWWLLNPWGLSQAPELAAIQQLLTDQWVTESLRAAELSGRYPADVRRALQEKKLWRFLVPSAERHTIATFPHFAAATQLCSAASLSLGIDVGVNMLGLLPVLLGGSSALQSEAARRIEAGAYCSVLLSELDHGSDLRANRTVARPGTIGVDGVFAPATGEATHYRIDGRKDLINGVSEHELLIVMARTGAPRSGGDINPLAEQGAFSLFLVDRSMAGVEWTKALGDPAGAGC